jgi:SAM-dependent methyltransferase
VSVPVNPWLEGGAQRGPDYDARFQRLADSGHDVHGEATLVAGFGPVFVLDAGCGTGRVAIELARREMSVVGVDLDPAMLASARDKAPGLDWLEGDLASLELGRTFDAIVAAGNVMIFLTPGTEAAVVATLARHLAQSGRLIAGFSLGAGRLDLATYDALAAANGLTLVERWATWDKEPFSAAGDYAVSVHQRLGQVRASS